MTLDELYRLIAAVPEADRKVLTVYAARRVSKSQPGWNDRVIAADQLSDLVYVLTTERDDSGWKP